MISIKSSIIINRPLGEVWEFLGDIDNYAVWQSSIEEVSATNGLETGSEITCTAHNFGKKFNFTATVLENDGRSRFKVVSQSGPVTFEGSYRLSEADDGGTLLEVETHGETSLAFRLAEPLLRQASQARQEGNLRVLKTILENQPQPAV